MSLIDSKNHIVFYRILSGLWLHIRGRNFTKIRARRKVMFRRPDRGVGNNKIDRGTSEE
jgi:hypothetical protein